jgi:hypothetical protein
MNRPTMHRTYGNARLVGLVLLRQPCSCPTRLQDAMLSQQRPAVLGQLCVTQCLRKDSTG